jgi:hypothetical protein
MLDFQKLITQINSVVLDHVSSDLGDTSQALINAQTAFEEAVAGSAAFIARLEQNEFLPYWPVSIPLEPIHADYPLTDIETPYTVVAADGSQIMPSHHEIFNCYLLNIGTTTISYGVKLAPILNSLPRLYHRPEDLYPLVDRRRVHVDELYVTLERNLLELTTIYELAVSALERKIPVIAFVDGSLIPWSLEKMPDNYQMAYMTACGEVLQSLQSMRIPLVGYISHSRSSDLINGLRVLKCPYPLSQCREYCGHLNEEAFPCSSIWPCTDRQLLSGNMKLGRRTCTFLSGATLARALPSNHQICFTYANVGAEVARLEFPRWVADDPELLNLAVAVSVAQARKGAGYPVSLSEAHNLAIIRGSDRVRFFEFLARHLVSLGMDRVRPSPKESRKRRGIV